MVQSRVICMVKMIMASDITNIRYETIKFVNN